MKKSASLIVVVLVLAWSALAYGSAEPAATPLPPAAAGFNWMLLLYAAIISIAGLVLLIIGYLIWELITPYSVKLHLIEHKNVAVAIVTASFILGMAIVIAAALLALAK
jgi:putative membrane protein